MIKSDSFIFEGNEWEEMEENNNFKEYENTNMDFQSLEYKRIIVDKSMHAYLNYNIVFVIFKDGKDRIYKS